MQGIILKTANVPIKREEVLPVYINDNIVCHFVVESFTETQVIGDFTINVEANLQFIAITDTQGRPRVIPAT